MSKALEIPVTELPEIEAALTREKNAKVVRWLLGIRLIALKRSPPQVARELHVSDRQVRRWVQRYLHGGVEAMTPAPRSGRPSYLSADDEERFKERIRRGPTREDGFATWRGPFVRAMLTREFGAHYRGNSVYELLHRMGFSTLMPRPKHPEASPEEQEAFQKKSCPRPSTPSSRVTRDEKSKSGSRTRRASVNRAP